MLRLLILIAVLAVPTMADAQARSVLMRLCNDAPFAVGVAAAYNTTPGGGRRAEGWFRVEAGDCLEGALHGVAGDRMGLAAFSGTWQWPAGEAAFSHCLPAHSFNTGVLDAPPCADTVREIAFTSRPIRPFRAEWGVVDWRVGCADFGEDADTCLGSPVERDGYSAPVRELQVCGPSLEGGLVALAEPVDANTWRVRGWMALEADSCVVVYSGFPNGDRVYVHGHAASEAAVSTTRVGDPSRATFCASGDVFDITAPASEIFNTTECPPEAPYPVVFDRIRWQSNVSRFTHFFRAGG